MAAYDWIVIGGGFTGAALGYELAKQGLKVLLLEGDRGLDNATRYSYGGLAYWSGRESLARQLCAEGIAIHRQLSQELEADTEFRELSLLLTVEAIADPQTVACQYEGYGIQPQVLSVREAGEWEPLLNLQAISGALLLPHGHVDAQKTAKAYLWGLERLGGEIGWERVDSLVQAGDRVVGVKAAGRDYWAARVVVCAGAGSRGLLRSLGVEVPLYFTYEQLLVTAPMQEIQLKGVVMPAQMERFALEAQVSEAGGEGLGKNLPEILDCGAVQFQDGRLYLGQRSLATGDPGAVFPAAEAESAIRAGLRRVLPRLADLPGHLHHCWVAFTSGMPLAGRVCDRQGLYLFSGFTHTLIYAPPLARHFARWVLGDQQTAMAQLRPAGLETDGLP